MKLYATITNEKGKQRSIGGDEKITIDLKHKNMRVKHLQFRIEQNTGGMNWEIIEIE